MKHLHLNCLYIISSYTVNNNDINIMSISINNTGLNISPCLTTRVMEIHNLTNSLQIVFNYGTHNEVCIHKAELELNSHIQQKMSKGFT